MIYLGKPQSSSPSGPIIERGKITSFESLKTKTTKTVPKTTKVEGGGAKVLGHGWTTSGGTFFCGFPYNIKIDFSDGNDNLG